MRETKTINDVTKEDVEILVSASLDLLGAATFMYWHGGYDKSPDSSERDAIEGMRRALNRIGLPQHTTAEFIKNLEGLLKLPPEKFAEIVAGISKADRSRG